MAGKLIAAARYYDPQLEGVDSHASEVIQTRYGSIVQIYLQSGNSVHMFEYLKWNGQRWEPLDWEYWRKDLKLSAGQRAIVPRIDWQKMKYQSGVYIPGKQSKWGDYVGEATADLELVDQRVVLKKFHFQPRSTEPTPSPRR